MVTLSRCVLGVLGKSHLEKASGWWAGGRGRGSASTHVHLPETGLLFPCQGGKAVDGYVKPQIKQVVPE